MPLPWSTYEPSQSSRAQSNSSITGPILPFLSVSTPHYPERVWFSPSLQKIWMMGNPPFTLLSFHFYRLHSITHSSLVGQVNAMFAQLVNWMQCLHKVDLTYRQINFWGNYTILEMSLGTIWMVLKIITIFISNPFLNLSSLKSQPWHLLCNTFIDYVVQRTDPLLG